MLMPALYQAVETVHIFIPVLAILACVIIFACSVRSSKSAQPPDDYLTEIKAKSKQKAKSNTKPTTSQSKPSERAEKHSPSPSAASDKSSLTQKQLANTKIEEKKVDAVSTQSPKKTPTKSPKHTANKSAGGVDFSPKAGRESPQNSAWVTVSSKRGRKEQKETQAVKNGPVAPPTVPVSVDSHRRKSSEGGANSDQRLSVSLDEFGNGNDIGTVEAEDADEWVMMGKDNRYRKSKRGKGVEKEVAQEPSGSNLEKINAGTNNINDFIGTDTRKRRNVRREN